MTTQGSDHPIRPALFGLGDIGVATEWREFSYDWRPILTTVGVALYSEFRDACAAQRNRWAYLVPDGSPREHITAQIGQKTDWNLRGIEHLLSKVGLLHVDVRVGASRDPYRPQRTRVAYYTVGRLESGQLTWSILHTVLDALMVAISPQPHAPVSELRRAKEALRVLGQAGFLQNRDPDHLFKTFGAWPQLIPTMIADERWQQLFTHLHGEQDMRAYCTRARAWVEYAHRLNERRDQANQQIQDRLTSYYRSIIDSDPSGGNGTNDLSASPGHMPYSDTTVTYDSQIPATSIAEGMRVTTRPSVAGNVAGESLESRQGMRVTHEPSATHGTAAHHASLNALSTRQNGESLQPQLINKSYRSIHNQDSGTFSDSDSDKNDSDISVSVAAFLDDHELHTTRLDGSFWCMVNRILVGSTDRYPATHGEKKAVERLRGRKEEHPMPVGVILAALRAVMATQIHAPTSLAQVMDLPSFHLYIQQAQALAPSRAAQLPQASNDFHGFLVEYRRLGRTHELRDVSRADIETLRSLFNAQPDACWDVLSRVEHMATKPDLSPSYIRKAIRLNEHAAVQAALQEERPESCAPATRPSARDNAPAVSSLRSAKPEGDRPTAPQKGLVQQLCKDLPPQQIDAAYILAGLDRTVTLTKTSISPLIDALKVIQQARKSSAQTSACPHGVGFGGDDRCARCAIALWNQAREHLRSYLPRPVFELCVGSTSHIAIVDPNRIIMYVATVDTGRMYEQQYAGQLCAAFIQAGVPAGDITIEIMSCDAVTPGKQGGGDAAQQGDPRDYRQLWHVVQKQLEQQLPQSEYTTWLAETWLVDIIEGQSTAIIATPNIFAREKLDGLYRCPIQEMLVRVLGFEVDLQFVIGTPPPDSRGASTDNRIFI
jgi:hypothetical protein